MTNNSLPSWVERCSRKASLPPQGCATCSYHRGHFGRGDPWVLLVLGLHAQLREDTGLSPAEAVFGALIVLPNEFLKGDEIYLQGAGGEPCGGPAISLQYTVSLVQWVRGQGSGVRDPGMHPLSQWNLFLLLALSQEKKTNGTQKQSKQNRVEHCTDCVRVQQNLIVYLQISKWNLCKKYVKSCSAWSVHCEIGDKREMWAIERAIGAVYSPRVWKKLYSEQLHSVQYKRYNLSRGHHCGRGVSGTAVRTVLVYYCIHSGLYTGTVHSVQ
jgi:hypothetical protein